MTGLPTTSDCSGDKEAGFSLVELLVSLTLLAMILALLPGAFRTGKRGWETASVIERRAAGDASIDYLRHRIAEAAPLFDKDESGRSRLAFSGGSQDLSFVAPAPSGPVGGGLYRFTLTAQPRAGAGSFALVLRMVPYRQQEPQFASVPSEHVLMPAIGSFHLRYFGIQNEKELARWSDTWPRQDQLPVMIELQAGGREEGAGADSPIRIELKLRSPA
jgi:general secretion pathway protein J